jgi:hypothetical protein
MSRNVDSFTTRVFVIDDGNRYSNNTTVLWVIQTVTEIKLNRNKHITMEYIYIYIRNEI